MNRDLFATYHPAVNFGYLCCVIVLGLMIQHPFWLVFSFGGALAYALQLGGRKAFKYLLYFVVPMVLLTALLNPIFVHQGIHPLFYLGRNPVTLEAALYGLTRGIMFGAGLLWFYCYNHLITGDKFMQLFGKVFPSGSLILSMVLGFLPRFTYRMKKVSEAQTALGQLGEPSKRTHLRNGLAVLSVMATWSLENAVDTADSMRSRGYGLPGRSSYAPFAMKSRDGLMVGILVGLTLLSLLGMFLGYSHFACYPVMDWAPVQMAGLIYYLSYGALCWIPFLMNMLEAAKWKHILSEI